MKVLELFSGFQEDFKGVLDEGVSGTFWGDLAALLKVLRDFGGVPGVIEKLQQCSRAFEGFKSVPGVFKGLRNF